MSIRTLHRSFLGGEIAPEMQGRVRDDYYLTGLKKCENFIVKPQGPVENRPGTKYVNRTKDYTKVTRLIPFTFSTTETMVIELGHLYIRLHTNGGSLISGGETAWATTTNYSQGDTVSYSGSSYYCQITHVAGVFATDLAAGKWYLMPSTGELELPTLYTSGITYDVADIFQLNFVQSEDVLTITHPGYVPKELRRLGTYQWTLTDIIFAPALPVAITPAATAYDKVTVPRDTTPPTDTDNLYEYVVTLLDEDGGETIASAEATCDGNLNSIGAENKITWVYYGYNPPVAFSNVYKKQGGIYGFIGSVKYPDMILWDNNIAPDMSITPPIYDEDSTGVPLFSSTDNYPAAVSYYEQRRVFAGTNNNIQTVWMTRAGTESNMSYSLPSRADDRVNFRIAAREANTIKHIVPLNKLLLLSSSAIWVIGSNTNQGINPSNVTISPQSYIGASNVQPVIINTTMLYAAARGGHIIECGFSFQNDSFVSGDLSLRAMHLFDDYEIVDIAYSRSPKPIIWAVSSSGLLLGFTYIPEQKIGAWHKHSTDGTYESCTVVAEGSEDILYVVVKRTINGATVRYVERINTRKYTELKDAYFVDCGLSYEGRNSQYAADTTVGSVNFGPARSMTLSGGSSWDSDETLTLTASSAAFLNPVSTDLGDVVTLIDSDGNKIRCSIESTASTTVATIRPDQLVPASLRSTAILTWEFARDTVSGLDHLEAKTVSILGDGAVYPQETVVSGSISIDPPASVIHVGLPYNSDIETLPLVAEIDESLAQGRKKNINQAWMKVYRSTGIHIGPSASDLTEIKKRSEEAYGSAPDLVTEELSVKISPSWGDEGSVYVRQSDPLPVTVLGLTLEAEIGT